MKILKRVQIHRWIFPVVSVVLIFGLLFIYASNEHKNEVKRFTEVATREEALYMSRNLNDRLIFIANDLLDTFEKSPPRNQSMHLEKTKHLIEANPFLQTINYIGPDRRIKFVSPLEPNRAVIGLKIEIAAPREALEMAASSHRPYLSKPFEIVQGNPGYSMMVPAPNNGFFEIVFTAENVFGKNSPFRRRADIVLRVSDGGVSVFMSPEYANQLTRLIECKGDAEGIVLNRVIHLSALPTGKLLFKGSRFWRVMALGSLLVSFVLMLSTIFIQALNIKERKRAGEERERLIGELQENIAKVNTLRGLLPICASCKRVRDDKGYWQQVEEYISNHSEVSFSHGTCPECAKKLYPGFCMDDK